MHLVRNNINTRDGTGTATLMPTDPEDMWHLHNLIRPGDLVRATALRRITLERGGDESTGPNASQKVRTTLTVKVIRVEFDPTVAELHVAGRVARENEYVTIGQHHTLDLELNKQFTLEKGFSHEGSPTRRGAATNGNETYQESSTQSEGWDSIALEQLKDATDMRKRAEVYAVIMQEGLAHICLVTEYQTLTRQRVETAVQRKRGPSGDAHDAAMTRFFDKLFTTLLRQLDPSIYSTSSVSATMMAAKPSGSAAAPTKQPPLLLASPGFIAANFHKYMLSNASTAPGIPSSDLKPLAHYLRTRVIVTHASSGHVHALSEVLKQPAVISQLADTRFARESELMERFLKLIREDEGRAWYGLRETIRAIDKGAVGRGGGVLLMSNKLFRAANVAERRKWVALVERVRGVEGGEVRILSSDHESGKKLEGLGDIGAILTFPLTDLDEDSEGEGKGEGEDEGKGKAGQGGDGQGAEALEGDIEDDGEEAFGDGVDAGEQDRRAQDVQEQLGL